MDAFEFLGKISPFTLSSDQLREDADIRVVEKLRNEPVMYGNGMSHVTLYSGMSHIMWERNGYHSSILKNTVRNREKSGK
jgi:hypothetical protein